MLTCGSLFTGIGGLDLGLERAGVVMSWQAEIDDYCIKVLEKHWPMVKRYGDIRTIKWSDVDPVDLICGGFPCQPVSCAGKQKGDSDDRWLWPEFFRAIREVRPKYALVENVPGLLSTVNGRLARRVFGDLAEIGYDSEWGIVSAADVGALHLRRRVFILAYPDGARTRMEVHRGGKQGWHSPAIGESAMVRQADGAVTAEGAGAGCQVAHSELLGREGFGFFDSPYSKEILGWCHTRNISPRGIWAVEPSVGRVANGVPARLDRLRCLGNAVVPQVAEVIGRWIIAREEGVDD